MCMHGKSSAIVLVKDGLAVLDEDDRVRLHMPAQWPGQLGVAPLSLRRGGLGDDAPRITRGHEMMRILDQETTRDLPDVATPRLGGWSFEQPSVLAFPDEGVDGPIAVAGCDDDIGLGTTDHALCGRRIDRSVQRHDTTERRLLVALKGPLVRVGEISGHRGAAG